MFTNAYNNVTRVFAAIGSWFGARWQDIKNALAQVATWFLTMFTNAYNNVTRVFAAIGSWFGARWNDITSCTEPGTNGRKYTGHVIVGVGEHGKEPCCHLGQGVLYIVPPCPKPGTNGRKYTGHVIGVMG